MQLSDRDNTQELKIHLIAEFLWLRIVLGTSGGVFLQWKTSC